jgi:tetratricopeptide (TPR) repeat protein
MQALQISPSNHEVFTQLGRFYERNNLPTKAIECYITALKLVPEYNTAWECIIALYTKTGNTKLIEPLVAQLLNTYVNC